MEKKKKIDYKKRRRNLIICIITFFIFVSSLSSYLDKLESKTLAEKTFREKNKEETTYIDEK